MSWGWGPRTGRPPPEGVRVDYPLVPATAPVQSLEEVLVHRFKGQRVPIETIQDVVLKETIFSERKHLKRATLAPLEREKKIHVKRPKGTRVIPGQYPPGTLVRFVDCEPV
jgi:hypothetical protein